MKFTPKTTVLLISALNWAESLRMNNVYSVAGFPGLIKFGIATSYLPRGTTVQRMEINQHEAFFGFNLPQLFKEIAKRIELHPSWRQTAVDL